jgi:hypothetical protein
MKAVPERMETVAENAQAGITWRRPCRDPGCDNDASDKPHKSAAPENDLRTTHDTTCFTECRLA